MDGDHVVVAPSPTQNDPLIGGRWMAAAADHRYSLAGPATGTDITDRKEAEERIRKENIALREEIDRASLFDEIVGSSAPLRRVLDGQGGFLGQRGAQFAPRVLQIGLLAGVLAVVDLEAGQLDLDEVKQGFDRSLGKG